MPIEATVTVTRQAAQAGHQVALQPVFSQLKSLMLLNEKNVSGLGEWVQRTRESMTLEQLQKNGW